MLVYNDLVKLDRVLNYLRQFQLDEYIPKEQSDFIDLVCDGLEHIERYTPHNPPIDLSDTAFLMLSYDFKERFIAEYWQLVLRYKKLDHMLNTWDALEFKPNCPYDLLDAQRTIMVKYIRLLEERAKIENIEL